MKKMLSVLFLMVTFVGALVAFEPSLKDCQIIKSPKNKYALVYFPQNETFIDINILSVQFAYTVKNTGSEEEKELNKVFAFYQETPTAEEYLIKIYKYLSQVPYYLHFYNMTEKEVANENGFKGGKKDGTYGKEWIKEYADIIIKGNEEGTFLIEFKE